MCRFFMLTGLLFIASLESVPANAQVPLRNARVEVTAKYKMVSELQTNDQRAIYSALPIRMQEDLWSMHLERFLAQHPDLNEHERGVVFEGLGLIAAGVLEVSRSSPEWEVKSNRPLLMLEERIKAVMPIELARAAFAQLNDLPSSDGIQEPSQISGARVGRSLKPHVETLDCECSTESNWCCVFDCLTSPTPHCLSGVRDGNCFPTQGCGTLFTHACDGYCGS